MSKVLGIILILIAIGIVFLLCLLCCFMSGKTEEYWEDLKREMEKRNERH